MPISDEQLKQILEAALMAAGEPLTIDKMMSLFVEEKEPPTRDAVKAALKQIEQESETRGIELKKVSSGYRFQAKKDFSPWVSRLWEEKPARYSRALLETLVLVAYKQPITRGEVEQVRGVAVSTNIIKTLLERDWVKVVGHREVPGRPALYGTTKAFLDYFNLKSLDELPTLAEIRDLESIKPELELDLEIQPPESEASAVASDEEGSSEHSVVVESELTEEIAEQDVSEVSEEEIDINIEDTDNIRGLTDASLDDEVTDESIAEEMVDEDESLEVVGVDSADDEFVAVSDEEGTSEPSVQVESELTEEITEQDDYQVSEEEVGIDFEDTNNIRGLTDASLDDEVTDESIAEEIDEEDESLEVVAVDDAEDEFAVEDEVDSKFGG